MRDPRPPEPTSVPGRLVEGLDSADAFELDARLRRAVRLEQRRLAEMGPLLLEVARSRVYRAYGCATLAAFAREWLGMSPRKAQMLLRLERSCALAPALREAFRSARLSWVQAHALVPIVVLEHAEPWRSAWVAHAERASVRRLEEDVERAMATGALAPGSTAAIEPDEAQTGASPTAHEETVRFFFTAPADVARLFRAVLATMQRRIERTNGRTASPSEPLDAMLAHCFATWGLSHHKVPREQRVFARDGWCCTVPGCTSLRNLHAHHIRFRSAGGSDELANQTTLCAWHHLRGVHAGIVRIRGRAPGALRFELGVRPPQPPLVAYATGGVRLPVG